MDTPADEMMPSTERGGHLNDVKYDAFLANDRLLRVINGSAMSNYHIDLGDLTPISLPSMAVPSFPYGAVFFRLPPRKGSISG
jgi:hypothetical protein